MISVLHVCRRFYPQSNGSETYTGSLIPLLGECGAQNTILAEGGPEESYSWHGVPVVRASDTRATPDRRRTRFLEQFVALLDSHEPQAVHWHYLPDSVDLMLDASVARGVRNIHTLHHPVTLCPRHDLMRFGDSLCTHPPSMVNCGPCMLNFRGMPRALAAPFASVTRAVPAILSRSLPQSRVKTSLNLVSDVGRWLADQQRSLRRFDSHVVLSRASAYLLERSGVDRQTIQVCRLGTRHEPPQHRTYLDWHEQRRPMRVIFVGRLDAVKGVVTLVEAALHFGANELQLDVFGVSGDAESKLRDLTKRDHGPVRFLGALPPEQVVDRMAEYDFVAIPSQFFETGPFTAVEALQAGTPLIASDMPSLTEFIEHGRTGWLVQPGSVDAWAAALRTLMDHPDTARDMSSQLAYPRTMRDVAREMFDLYSRALPANKSM